jgi:hypothetical protein
VFDDKREDRALERIAAAFEKLADCFCSLVHHLFAATDFQLVQKGDFQMGAITGIQAGSSDFFTASLIPANAAPLQSGPVFSTTDTLVTLTPDSTNPFKVTAAVAAGDTAASFPLTVTGVNSAGTTITHTFTIPITQAPPPVALDFDLSQGA